jgi:hypothetical protein
MLQMLMHFRRGFDAAVDANRELREMRRSAHKKINNLITIGAIKTDDVYLWLSAIFEKPRVDFHIAELEPEEVAEVIRHCDRVMEKIMEEVTA